MVGGSSLKSYRSHLECSSYSNKSRVKITSHAHSKFNIKLYHNKKKMLSYYLHSASIKSKENFVKTFFLIHISLTPRFKVILP